LGPCKPDASAYQGYCDKQPLKRELQCHAPQYSRGARSPKNFAHLRWIASCAVGSTQNLGHRWPLDPKQRVFYSEFSGRSPTRYNVGMSEQFERDYHLLIGLLLAVAFFSLLPFFANRKLKPLWRVALVCIFTVAIGILAILIYLPYVTDG